MPVFGRVSAGTMEVRTRSNHSEDVVLAGDQVTDAGENRSQHWDRPIRKTGRS